MTMSEGEEAISLSDAESEGEGPNIRPPQPSASLNKHKQKKRKRSRESSKYKRRSDERQKEKGGRDYERRRERDRSRNDVDSRRERGDNQDLRHQIIRGKYDRDRDRNPRDGERRHYDRSSSEKRKDKNPDQEERKNRILMADKMLEEKRKEAEARKKTKLLEQEMERLQAVLKRKKAGQRSRSRSKGHKKKKKRKKSRSASSASESNEEMETETKKSGSDEESEDDDDQASTEVEEEQSESEEESESGEGSDSTASQKSEDTPEHEDNSSEDGEVEDDEEDKKLEELAEKVAIKSSKDNDETKPMEEDKTPEKSPRIGGKWADKSPNRTPSRSPTPLKEDSDRTPGHGSGKGSRLNSPSTGALQPLDGMDSPPASPIPLKDELPPYLPSVHGCRNVAEFKCLNRIEEGTYGVVYRARDKRTNEIVALKKLKMEREKEGFPITSLREVNTLLIAQHPNVVHVREIVVGSIMDHIFIVMEFVQHDLKALMETLRKKNQVFLPGEVKCLMVQLLRAIKHLHDNWILHRDLKASNLLLSHKGILKVGDFGLAREYGSPLKHYTSVVVTLWYRSPELLLGTKEYSTHIDVWSIGCIFGELLLMEPLFPGKSEVDELNRIFKLLGTPSEKVWPGYKELPGVQKMKFVDYPISHLREKFPAKMLSEEGIQLLKDLLCYDPKRRITCDEALKAEYFMEDPRPVDPSMFPTWPAKSEQEPGDKVKKASSPKPPSGGHAFKKNLDDDDEARAKGFNLKGGPAPPSFTLKF